MQNEQTVFERYRREIYRIGWRVQYRARKIKQRELPMYDGELFNQSFTVPVDDRIVIEQLINTLPMNGREVLHKIYFEGYTEAEVARYLNMSQQAVNKWKRKMLNLLSQKVSS
ncbi:hypothetical protein ASD24_27325 [Paenibacillus sp. Root52]|uniref:DNA-directed RNA polymerase specialized sigma24 family protein n=2 Tax=Paenibacillus TaxID=44249 RepID=A0AAP5H5T9_PAEAM|nr:hypothetical protein ASD24_27325 [Paenibacillus sp. Root52]MDR6726870.1 DNA-directed RNA polymerase specialized sigma24 family protein [Paenibacillus amylolyticus]